MTAPTDTDRKLGRMALEKSREAHARGKLLVMHYKCDGFDADPCKARLMAVKDTAKGTDSCFDAMTDEAKGLSDFRQFAESHADRVWLVWNMRNPRYGWPHLQMRAAALGTAPLPDLDLVDLALARWQLYGDFPGHPKMLLLARENGISTQDILEPSEARNTSQTMGDALRRIEIIYAIWHLMIAGNLRMPNADNCRETQAETEFAKALKMRPKWEEPFKYYVAKDYYKEHGIRAYRHAACEALDLPPGRGNVIEAMKYKGGHKAFQKFLDRFRNSAHAKAICDDLLPAR